MRLIVLFALAAGVIAATADDASAFGKRKRGRTADACCTSSYGGYGYGGYAGGHYGGPAYAPAPSCCGGAVGWGAGYGGYHHAHAAGYGGYHHQPYASGYATGVAGACCGGTGLMTMPMPGVTYPAQPAVGQPGYGQPVRPDVLPAGGVTTPGTGTDGRVPDPMPDR